MRIAACLLAVALASAGCSQIVIVPPTPDGARTEVDVTWEKGRTAFGKQGYAFYIDRLFDVVYRVEAEDIERDFGPALTPMRAILAAGLPELPHSYAALLESPKGPLGELALSVGDKAPVVLTQAGQGYYIDGYPDTPRVIDRQRLARDFASALESQAEALKAMGSYLALLEHPDGGRDRLVYRGNGREYALDRAGQGLSLDGTARDMDSGDIERDFGPALAAEREILAAGLPELSHSQAILLAHERGPLGELLFTPAENAAARRLDRPGAGIFIDGYPNPPGGIDPARLRRDFGASLSALELTLKAMRSYIILLESPDGAASKVIYRTGGEAILLEHPGASLTLDGLGHDPDAGTAEKDFDEARVSTKQILDEGLPKLPHSYVALISHPAGALGEVEIIEGNAQGAVLTQSGQAVIIDGYSDKIHTLDAEQYRRDFGDALDATPPPPVSHYLYFDSGSTRLARASREALSMVLEAIRGHPAADIAVAGHADTVGGDALNDRLSLKRGEAIADWIRKSGVPFQEISLTAFGKTSPAIDTPDNTPELLNRRVEIVIR